MSTLTRIIIALVATSAILIGSSIAGIDSTQSNHNNAAAFGSSITSSQLNFVYANGANIDNLQSNNMIIEEIDGMHKLSQINIAILIESDIGTSSTSKISATATSSTASGDGNELIRKIKITDTFEISGDKYVKLSNVGTVTVAINQWFIESGKYTTLIDEKPMKPSETRIVRANFEPSKVDLFENNGNLHDEYIVK